MDLPEGGNELSTEMKISPFNGQLYQEHLYYLAMPDNGNMERHLPNCYFLCVHFKYLGVDQGSELFKHTFILINVNNVCESIMTNIIKFYFDFIYQILFSF